MRFFFVLWKVKRGTRTERFDVGLKDSSRGGWYFLGLGAVGKFFVDLSMFFVEFYWVFSFKSSRIGRDAA